MSVERELDRHLADIERGDSFIDWCEDRGYDPETWDAEQAWEDAQLEPDWDAIAEDRAMAEAD